MTLQQLKYVIAVADSGSMSDAAKVLYVSQPGLSNAIKELERELRCQLFIRTNKGIVVSAEGHQFLSYARQVVEQMLLLEENYLGSKRSQIHFGVSAQHYSFAVQAFADLIREHRIEEYDFQLRETRTSEILDDVKNHKSEIGILYLNQFNEKVLCKLLKEYGLKFTELFVARPHIFVSRENPLAFCDQVSLKDLEGYPYLSFEQGEFNSFYFSEEILSTTDRKKIIKVSDRATLFNLLIGANGYTISTGIISERLNGMDIVAVPLMVEEEIRIGYITRADSLLSRIGEEYIEKLKKSIADTGNG